MKAHSLKHTFTTDGVMKLQKPQQEGVESLSLGGSYIAWWNRAWATLLKTLCRGKSLGFRVGGTLVLTPR